MIAIDLFCGAGGLSCGLQDAGFDVALGVDVDIQALTSYQNYFQNTIALNEDINNVSAQTITKLLGLTPRSNFLLAGCPPCQGFSSLGKRDPYDEKNQLVFQYTRLIDELKPTFILMENVPGMSKNVGKEIFKEVVKKLSNEYFVEYATLNAADFGVPQTRKRLVLHGVRKDIYEQLKCYLKQDFTLLPEQTHCAPKKNINNNYQNWRTVGETIMNLPPLVAGQSYEGRDIHNHVCRNLSETNIKRLAIAHEHNGSRTSLPEELCLPCHNGVTTFSDTYGIMRLDRPAPTLTSGCTTISKGRFGHPTQNRGISLREAAKLQTFPDNFRFFGSISSISLQIGNAVPPQLAKASADKIYYYMTLVEEMSDKKHSSLVS